MPHDGQDPTRTSSGAEAPAGRDPLAPPTEEGRGEGIPRASAAAPAAARTLLSRLSWPHLGLPLKLLVLTSVFVMLAEVLIFVPSVANFRVNWLNDRLTAARLAALAAEAVPDGAIPGMLRMELLRTAAVKAVALRRDGSRRLVLPPDEPMVIDAHFDLRPMQSEVPLDAVLTRAGLIGEALALLARGTERTIRVVGPLDGKPDDFIEIVLPEQPLRAAMLRYGTNIFWLSIVISLFTAALVYVALSGLLVRPMMRISSNMVRFAERPEDLSRIIVPSGRTDEVGVAERELAAMQRQLSSLLLQKNRLAQLGLAVSKINHDLRNMLASAQLMSDRLGELPDPAVQRFAPKLIASLDRAINFCNDTLRFGRAEEAEPRRELMLLRPLVEEIGDGLGLPREGLIDWHVEIDDKLRIDADREHLYRVLGNLCRNAVQVLETQAAGSLSVPLASSASAAGAASAAALAPAAPSRLVVRAQREGREVTVEVRDNGPGVPERARQNLFTAFAGSQRKGGTGLGLAIAAELIAAHGGRITLAESGDGPGATFRIVVPDRDPMQI
ncbi:MAG: HAMP domain-containing sensor histidine kinase [Hyphomicrobiaceae bacterium]|nr:HAMP domain-containing sensor histidine kinase [Hyphomicrobiaceae bacterium]